MIDDIKKTLWASVDKLRANMDAAEYKHLVLGLIFVKYLSDAFVARQAELTLRLRDPADELFYGDAADEDIAAELEDRDYYTSENVFWVPEGARWDALRAACCRATARHWQAHRRRLDPDIRKKLGGAGVCVLNPPKKKPRLQSPPQRAGEGVPRLTV